MLRAGATLTVDVDPAFEHGVLVDAGPVTIDFPDGDRSDGARPDTATAVPWAQLAYFEPGRERVRLRADADPVRVVLLGGLPFDEELVMWWNFIGRSHDEIVEFRRRWQSDVIARNDPDGPFGTVPGYDGAPLPSFHDLPHQHAHHHPTSGPDDHRPDLGTPLDRAAGGELR